MKLGTTWLGREFREREVQTRELRDPTVPLTLRLLKGIFKYLLQCGKKHIKNRDVPIPFFLPIPIPHSWADTDTVADTWALVKPVHETDVS